MQRILALFVPLALLAGCVSPSRPAPQAPPPPRPVPVPPPAPTPPPASSDWRDWPLTAGTWSYSRDAQGSIARFGQPGAEPELSLRCDRSAGALVLSRRGTAPGNAAMTVRTNTSTRALPSTATAGAMTVRLPVRDALIDAMGFSRGRFVVELRPLPVLVVPTWAEFLRVAEDCRG
ncbi:hypothetical protein OKW76_13910 [Sphingomonas sp. S1-29]|uniref:hypothetical protein n=1 Tax=Sphingomonas sp. S1-29 TaxID=2991074 RepID=UPI00223F2EA0|nr:hypothetical protein [Sphingomonas sp. S1-29]UZK69105.1 hypothetical protein OKW76_13910 [Sphingomonas sp. S1-29]